jgi:hypothetical protein
VRHARSLLTVLLLSTIAIRGTSGQPVTDSVPPAAPRGSEILIPIGSFFLPGLGQYIHGETPKGLAYSATFVAGAAVGATRDVPDSLDLPFDPQDQLSDIGWSVSMSAMWLSSWDAFHRALPAHKRLGRYQFLPERESLGQLITAPLDYRFLKRWTTWVDIAQTALITTIILSEPDSDERWSHFRGHDALYAAAGSLNAAVGEEAFFRGYALPMLHQRTGQKFWLANGTQAAVFGGLHASQAGLFAGVIGAWALWEGWVTRRNNWSIRESVFHHFWYDAAVITASMVVDDNITRRRVHRIGFSGIPF